jgi:hypothetical protein
MEPISLHVFRDNAAGDFLVALAPADKKGACRCVGLAISRFSSALLAFTVTLIAMISLAIKCERPGPFFERQES